MQWLILVKLFWKMKKKYFSKNHFEIQVHTKIVCTLYSIKYGNGLLHFFAVTTFDHNFYIWCFSIPLHKLWKTKGFCQLVILSTARNTVALLANIRLSWKMLLGTNTLAYFAGVSVIKTQGLSHWLQSLWLKIKMS